MGEKKGDISIVSSKEIHGITENDLLLIEII
jgi:hypothetical protein